MAATLFARTARGLAAQGNINTSNSDMNLSGHKSPATPNARDNCTSRQMPK